MMITKITIRTAAICCLPAAVALRIGSFRKNKDIDKKPLAERFKDICELFRNEDADTKSESNRKRLAELLHGADEGELQKVFAGLEDSDDLPQALVNEMIVLFKRSSEKWHGNHHPDDTLKDRTQRKMVNGKAMSFAEYLAQDEDYQYEEVSQDFVRGQFAKITQAAHFKQDLVRDFAIRHSKQKPAVFVDAANTCRSPMAEVLWRYFEFKAGLITKPEQSLTSSRGIEKAKSYIKLSHDTQTMLKDIWMPLLKTEEERVFVDAWLENFWNAKLNLNDVPKDTVAIYAMTQNEIKSISDRDPKLLLEKGDAADPFTAGTGYILANLDAFAHAETPEVSDEVSEKIKSCESAAQKLNLIKYRRSFLEIATGVYDRFRQHYLDDFNLDGFSLDDFSQLQTAMKLWESSIKLDIQAIEDVKSDLLPKLEAVLPHLPPKVRNTIISGLREGHLELFHQNVGNSDIVKVISI